ncbi:MAG: hypothetical protein KAR17_11670, partial [Cyclobacteriaceae bacterium]|nr:hypothetical protein [Cyclobacteriaceae bacterium]
RQAGGQAGLFDIRYSYKYHFSFWLVQVRDKAYLVGRRVLTIRANSLAPLPTVKAGFFREEFPGHQ